jgi:hypothetical protein
MLKIIPGLVWSSCGHRSERPTVTPQANPGHSLPPRVNPQVVRLGLRALVAQGIEQRFPKPHTTPLPQAADLRFSVFRSEILADVCSGCDRLPKICQPMINIGAFRLPGRKVGAGGATLLASPMGEAAPLRLVDQAGRG